MRVEALLLACCGLTKVVSAPGEGVASGNNVDKVADTQGAEAHGSPAPPYVESLALLERNGEALRNLLPHGPLQVTDPRRHYVLIAGVLACVVEYLNSDCTPPDYEHEFLPAVDILLPVVWQDPTAAVAKLETFIEDTKEIVQTIQDLVELNCKGLKPPTCNAVLQAISDTTTDEFDDSLELLILVGQLAEIYEKNRYAEDAKNFTAVTLLLTGKKKLKPLVYKGAEVYNLLYGRHCEP